MSQKGPYIVKELKALSQGSQVWGKYLIQEKISRKTKDGREVTNLKLGDSSGEIDAVVWDNCVVSGDLAVGCVIGLLGDMGVYNNHQQITAKRLKVLEEDIQPYLRTPTASIDSLIKDFDQLVESVKDPYMRELLQEIFTPEMREAFFGAPAAKKIHHNYKGGLLEHTVSVGRLCQKAAQAYSNLNGDMLITGAILHDIGKIEEYQIKTVPEYTVQGRMVGHIVLGSELVGNQIIKIRREKGQFPEELELMLRHMILSHHGNLEYGSPVKPLFPEALLLHMMDNLDAKIYIFFHRIEEAQEEEDPFTAYDNILGQYLYKYRYNGITDQ